MIPRITRGLIISTLFFLFCMWGIADDLQKGTWDRGSFSITCISTGFFAWYGLPFAMALSGVLRRRRFIKEHTELQGGEYFTSVDGKCAIVWHPGTMRVALIDSKNNVAFCKPGDIVDCELEIDKVEGTDLGVSAWWVNIVGGFSGAEVEADRVRSVTLRVTADNLDVPSVNLFFLQNRGYKRMTGSYADAVDLAKKWEDKMSVFAGDFDGNDRDNEDDDTAFDDEDGNVIRINLNVGDKHKIARKGRK